MKESTLQYRTEAADYSVAAPLCVVDHYNQIVLAGIVGASTVVRGIVAALREKNPLVWRTDRTVNVASSRPFLVTYDVVQNLGGGDRRIALLISDTSKINIISHEDEDTSNTRNHLAYAFGNRPEEIAWDIMSFLDIPLLPDWSGFFVHVMREKGWLKPIQSVGLDFAWVFSASRSEYLTEVAGRLGNDFRAPAKNRGWVVRTLDERIGDSFAMPHKPIIRISKEPKVSAAAAEGLALANRMPEQLLLLHSEGKSDSPGPVKSRSVGTLSLTTFHQVQGLELVIRTQSDGYWTQSEVKLVQEVEISAAD